MIKCEVIEKFTLQRFNELKNIERVAIDLKGQLYVGDKFECTKEMADYLMGNNDKKAVVVKIIGVEPEIKASSQSPVEELKKAMISVETKIKTDTYKEPKRKKTSKK